MVVRCDDGMDATRWCVHSTDMYSTRSWFKHNLPALDSIPHNCLQDLIRLLLHFVDDWEIEDDENWDDMFDYPRYDNHVDNNK